MNRPRADGDREALRILLGARREMTTTKTRQVNRLRALLLGGDDTDRDLARGTLTDARLVGAVLAEPHDEWAEGRRYLGPEVLQRARLTLLPAAAEEVSTTKTTRRTKALSA